MNRNSSYSFKTLVHIDGIIDHSGKVESILEYSDVLKISDTSPQVLHANIASSLPANLQDIKLEEQTYIKLDSIIIPEYLIVTSTIEEINKTMVNFSVEVETQAQKDVIYNTIRSLGLEFTVT